MRKRNLILPGNPRYQPESLQEIFGYDNLYVPVGEVELAVLDTLGEMRIIPAEDMALLTPDVRRSILDIATSEVDGVERRATKHAVRAWIRIVQERLPVKLRRWLHIPLTTYDPLDTARSLQFIRAHERVLKSETRELIRIFAGLITRFAGTLQVGRTHGQHALPITVGFWFATILNRIIYNSREMDRYAVGLVGKISGAVGAYNAQRALKFPRSFEERVLERLGLKPAPISTQILPPEPLAYFLFSCSMFSAVLAQFGRDCRQLMRTEIGEVAEEFEEGQVGSSTMPHKRNPINFENSEGMWIRTKNEFGKVLDTLISEHQRDLVGSSVARDFPIIVVNLTHQLETLLRPKRLPDGTQGKSFLERIIVDESACRRNFDMSAHVILAEPIYIALQMAGYQGDAHEVVNRRAVALAQASQIPLIEAIELIAQEDEELMASLRNIPEDIIRALRAPENYTGDATEKALEVATEAFRYVGN